MFSDKLRVLVESFSLFIRSIMHRDYFQIFKWSLDLLFSFKFQMQYENRPKIQILFQPILTFKSPNCNLQVNQFEL